MKIFNHKLALLLSSLLLCCSCIDEFEADLPSTETAYLVVEGSICGESECVFLLSRSLSLSPSPEEIVGYYIADAKVTVCATDGSKFQAAHSGKGQYTVELGKLDHGQQYWLEIEWEGHTFASEPGSPIETKEIVDISYAQPRPDEMVDILITPAAPTDNGVQYFRWDYVEDWEIRTPYLSYWDFDIEQNKVIKAPFLTYRGWCHEARHSAIISSNTDFVNGEIRNLKLYDIENSDSRFNYLYRTTIKQRAISREEYEYELLSKRQTDEMGGLFTPQPSELPTNIHCTDGTRKAIGFVGVSYNEALVKLFIRGDEVGYKLGRIPRGPSEDDLAKMTNSELYKQQYRIHEYDELAGQITWIDRWAVDCRVWGADIFAMPEGWPENKFDI